MISKIQFMISAFQFHKVQLKDHPDLCYYSLKAFQFHKVQLKVKKSPLIMSSTATLFQFHKVQLKALLLA